LFPGDVVIVRLKTPVQSNLWAWSAKGTREVDVQVALQETRWRDVSDSTDTRGTRDTVSQELQSQNLLRVRLSP
jgi:hypothetical protein